MVAVCFYFHVHQPFRLAKYSIFDIGNHHNYFDEKKNKEVLRKVAHKCYLPMNRLLLDLIKQHHGHFKVSFSVTGVVLDQFERYAPEVLQSFKDLAATGCVDFVAETYYHSLSYLFSKNEFDEQVRMQEKKIEDLFGIKPTVFRNTELIFNNDLANHVEGLGYNAILAEGADHILGWRSPNFLYRPVYTENIKALLKNYRLSDDIAFRFGNKGWADFPLNVEKYVQWLNAVNGNGNTINLFMDYETFGEHQWEDTGIFEFMRHLPGEFLKHPDNSFKTVSEVAESYQPVGDIDMHHFVSWADIERDVSAWLGNPIQDNAIHQLYAFEKAVKESGDKHLIEDWRKLTTSDHFYYMCTKWFNDGDVHKYFSPYESPYEAFISFMNVLNDMAIRLKEQGITVRSPESQVSISENPIELLTKSELLSKP
jgi:alpha-amylase